VKAPYEKMKVLLNALVLHLAESDGFSASSAALETLRASGRILNDTSNVIFTFSCCSLLRFLLFMTDVLLLLLFSTIKQTAYPKGQGFLPEDMNTEYNRLKSFAFWTKSKNPHVTPVTLVKAGFYHQPKV
jgi:hypothetical protein